MLSSGVAQSLITGGFTLLGGLSVFWVNKGRDNKVRTEQKAERERLEQRESVVAVLAQGREWCTHADGVILIAAMTPNAVDFSNSAAANEYGPSLRAMSRALITARLLSRAHSIRSELLLITAGVDSLGADLARLLDSAEKRRGHADPAVLGKAMALVNAVGLSLDKLEAAALAEMER